MEPLLENQRVTEEHRRGDRTERTFSYRLYLLLMNALSFRIICVSLPPRTKEDCIMTTLALNNLWAYIQSLSLPQSDREWLADKLIESAKTDNTQPDGTANEKVRRRNRTLSAEVEMLGNLHLKEFTQEELKKDPLLAAIVEDRRERK